MDQLSVVIGEFKRWGCRSNLKAAFRDAGLLQFFDHARMNGLNVYRNILRDELFPFGVDFAERSRFSLLCRLFQRTPFHKNLSALSCQHSAKPNHLSFRTASAVRNLQYADSSNLKVLGMTMAPVLLAAKAGIALSMRGLAAFSYPIFMPASLRSMLPLPICLNIFRIWAYWRRRLLTSCTVLPDPRAIRLRRLPLITSW